MYILLLKDTIKKADDVDLIEVDLGEVKYSGANYR